MEISRKARLWRKGFFYVAVVFMLTVVIQVFLAGIATFVDPVTWYIHVVFVKVIQYLPIMMLIISFMGKAPKVLRWQSVGLFALIILMYASANISSLGAFHPVIALMMFWSSIVVVQKAWKSAFRNEGNE